MPSHLRSPSQLFLEYKIASRHVHRAAVALGATAWVALGVTVVCQMLDLNGVKQRMKSRKARVRDAELRRSKRGWCKYQDNLLLGGLRRKVC